MQLTAADYPKLCTFMSNLIQHLWSYCYTVYAAQTPMLSRWQISKQTLYMVFVFQINSFHLCVFGCSIPWYGLCKYRPSRVEKIKNLLHMLSYLQFIHLNQTGFIRSKYSLGKYLLYFCIDSILISRIIFQLQWLLCPRYSTCSYCFLIKGKKQLRKTQAHCEQRWLHENASTVFMKYHPSARK